MQLGNEILFVRHSALQAKSLDTVVFVFRTTRGKSAFANPMALFIVRSKRMDLAHKGNDDYNHFCLLLIASNYAAAYRLIGVCRSLSLSVWQQKEKERAAATQMEKCGAQHENIVHVMAAKCLLSLIIMRPFTPYSRVVQSLANRYDRDSAESPYNQESHSANYSVAIFFHLRCVFFSFQATLWRRQRDMKRCRERERVSGIVITVIMLCMVQV